MIHLTKQTAYQLDLVVSSVFFFFSLMHLYACAVNVCPVVLPFPGSSAPSGTPQGRGCSDLHTATAAEQPHCSQLSHLCKCLCADPGWCSLADRVYLEISFPRLSPPTLSLSCRRICEETRIISSTKKSCS